MLPDDSTGQDPGSLARKLSRCKEGMACFLPSLPSVALAKEGMVQILMSITRVAPAPLLQIKSGGTRLIGAANLSPVTKLVAGTGAVSRYNLSRSRESVKVQDLYCGQMRVSGCNNHYKFVLSAGSKAKTVTNNLPILSVLAVAFILCYLLISVFIFYLFKEIESVNVPVRCL